LSLWSNSFIFYVKVFFLAIVKIYFISEVINQTTTLKHF